MSNYNPRPRSSPRSDYENLSSPSSAFFDLERVFSHPAGLRVARRVTESLIAQRPLFGTSPEVMSRLGDILVFSEEYTTGRSSALPNGTGGKMNSRNLSHSAEASGTLAYSTASTTMPAPGYMGSGRALPQLSWSNPRNPAQAHPSSQPPFYSSNSMANDTVLPPIWQSAGQNALTSQRSHARPSYPQCRRAFPSNEDRRSINSNPFHHDSRNQAGNYSHGPAQVTNSNSTSRAAPPSRINSESPRGSWQHTTSTNRTNIQNNASASEGSANNTLTSAVELSNSSLPPEPQTHTFVPFNYTNPKMAIPKRKALDHEGTVVKKQRVKTTLSKRAKAKEVKPDSAVTRVTAEIWMRILEFSAPSFLRKAQLINKKFKGIVEQYQNSLFVNCREENGIPPPPIGINEKQLNSLLGGFKGCQEEGCKDKKAHRTHWSFMKRVCHECWQAMVMREDKVLKSHASPPRATLLRLLECIPVAIQDSFLKAHDYKDDLEAARGQPRLYKVYSIQDIDRVIEEYKNLGPGDFVADPALTQGENDAAQREHERLLADLPAKQEEYLTERKAKNDTHMTYVKNVEEHLRNKRAKNKVEIDLHRNSRKELFTRRAREDLPDVSTEFVQATKAYRAACRIFRNGGSERGWQQLKPKIQMEWDDFKRSGVKAPAAENKDPQKDGSADSDANNIDEDPLSDDNGQQGYLDGNYSHMQAGSFESSLDGGHSQTQSGLFGGILNNNHPQIHSDSFSGNQDRNYQMSDSFTGMNGSFGGGFGLSHIHPSNPMLGHASSSQRHQSSSRTSGHVFPHSGSSTPNIYGLPPQASAPTTRDNIPIHSLLNNQT